MKVSQSIIIAALFGVMSYEQVQAIDITHHHKHHHKAHKRHHNHHHNQSLVQGEEPGPAPVAPAEAAAPAQKIDSADRVEKEADPVLEAAKTDVIEQEANSANKKPREPITKLDKEKALEEKENADDEKEAE